MKKSTGIALGIGIGAAVLAIGAGAYYIYKQAKKIDEVEDDDVEYVNYDELNGMPSINGVSLSGEDIDIDVD